MHTARSPRAEAVHHGTHHQSRTQQCAGQRSVACRLSILACVIFGVACSLSCRSLRFFSGAKMFRFVWPHTISSLVDGRTGSEYLLLRWDSQLPVAAYASKIPLVRSESRADRADDASVTADVAAPRTPKTPSGPPSVSSRSSSKLPVPDPFTARRGRMIFNVCCCAMQIC